jgi:hypothetical protein
MRCDPETCEHPEGDTDARRLAVERSEHKLMTIKEIESDPIATIERMKEHRRRICQVGNGVSLSLDQPPYFISKQAVTIMGTDSSQIRDCEHLRSIEAMTTPVISAG